MNLEDQEAQWHQGFRARGQRILRQIVSGPRPPKDDWERRLLFHAIARLGLGEQVNIALHDLAEVNEHPPGEYPFFLHGNIDAYLRFHYHYPDALKQKVQEIMCQVEQFDPATPKDTENKKIMRTVAGYLTAQTWPQWEGARRLQEMCQQYLTTFFDRVGRYGQGEFDASTYSVFYLNTLATLFDFARDPAMRLKARMMLDWFLLNTAGEWLDGALAGGHSRDYQPIYGVEWAPAGVQAAWLYFGGRDPDLSKGEPHYCVINALSSYHMPLVIAQIAQDRSRPFVHRETHDLMDVSLPTHDGNQTAVLNIWGQPAKGFGYVSKVGVRKYTYMAAQHALGSFYDGKEGDVLASGQRRWSLDWVSDRLRSVFFFTHPFPSGPDDHDYRAKWSSSSPYEQVVQHEGKLIAVYNVPQNKTYKFIPSAEMPAPVPSDANPYIEGFFSRQAIVGQQEHASGWIFCHGGSVLFAVRPLRPYQWIEEIDEDGEPYLRLQSFGLKNGVIVESANPSDYGSQSLGADQPWAAELDRFAEVVLAKTAVNADFDSEQPTIGYTALNGDQLSIQYNGQRTVNGIAVDYNHWPLIENPYVQSKVGAGVLTTQHRGLHRILDYRRWTITDAVFPES